jgi:hypothetical protein
MQARGIYLLDAWQVIPIYHRKVQGTHDHIMDPDNLMTNKYLSGYTTVI